MEFLNAIFGGIIQGLTEFLPVSSSGHLSLFQHYTAQSGETGLFMSIMLHFGTLVAVCFAFRKTIAALITEFFSMIGGLFSKTPRKANKEMRRMIVMVIISLLPLLPFYFLRDFFSGLASDDSIVVEGFCFLLTGTLLLFASKVRPGKKTAATMSAGNAVTVGLAQCAAMLPGLSRSGSTISTGLLCGFKREFAVEFSFIMSIPTILAAFLMELLDLAKGEGNISVDLLPVLLGMVTAAVVGHLAIRLIRLLVSNGGFRIFGYYTLLLGAVVITIELTGLHP